MRKSSVYLFIFAIAALAAAISPACVAQTAVPESVAPMAVAVPVMEKVEIKKEVEEPKPTHRFFDKTNLSLSAMTISGALADGITTQHALGQHRSSTAVVNGVSTNYAVTYVEQNPVAAPLVNRGWPGQIAATALTAGADLGIRNWLHRTGHHRMERVVPFLFAATSASFAAHNAKYW